MDFYDELLYCRKCYHCILSAKDIYDYVPEVIVPCELIDYTSMSIRESNAVRLCGEIVGFISEQRIVLFTNKFFFQCNDGTIFQFEQFLEEPNYVPYAPDSGVDVCDISSSDSDWD